MANANVVAMGIDDRDADEPQHRARQPLRQAPRPTLEPAEHQQDDERRRSCARSTSTGRAAPSLWRPMSKPKTADTISVNRSRGHAKMRVKPSGVLQPWIAMRRTIEHAGHAQGALRLPDRRHPPPFVRAGRRSPRSGGGPSHVPARAAPRIHSHGCEASMGAERETEIQDPERRRRVASSSASAALMHHGRATTRPARPSPALAAGADSMRAMTHRCYGVPRALRLETIAKPTPAAGAGPDQGARDERQSRGVVRVSGKPLFVRLGQWHRHARRTCAPGYDMAGTVEAVGENVTRFKPGDEVFGGAHGAMGEYVIGREKASHRRQARELSLRGSRRASRSPAITALQGLRDQGHLAAGQKVLINGASGGVGTTPCRSRKRSARK